MPIALARSGESRPARNASPSGACKVRASSVHPATVHSSVSRYNAVLLASHAAGQMPTMPLLPPVKPSHW